MKKIVLLLTSIILIWLFVGFDLYVGDHEEGNHWDMFIKHKPVTTMLFRNPAEQGLDLSPFDNLSASRRKSFDQYCQVRYGIEGIKRCYDSIHAERY